MLMNNTTVKTFSEIDFSPRNPSISSIDWKLVPRSDNLSFRKSTGAISGENGGCTVGIRWVTNQKFTNLTFLTNLFPQVPHNPKIVFFIYRVTFWEEFWQSLSANFSYYEYTFFYNFLIAVINQACTESIITSTPD